MGADAFGHGRDPGRIAKSDRQPAGAGEEVAVGAEPAGGAAARQGAVGDDDVGFGAGAKHVGPGDEVAAAGGEQAPAAAVPFDGGGAERIAAGGVRESLE